MQLDALVGWTVLPPSGSAQCVSAGPGVALPGLGHMDGPSATASVPLSLTPLLEPEPPLDPEPLELIPPLELDPLLDVLPLPEPELLPELELLVPSIPESAALPLSELHAPMRANKKATDSPSHMEMRETTDR